MHGNNQLQCIILSSDMHIKLSRTAKALKQWAKKKIGNNKLLFIAARQLIGILDVVQEHRQLSQAELQ